jgi:hypothetical protein
LPDEQIAKMLDFDKPLKDQTPEIQALAKQYGLTDADHLGGDLVAAMDAKRPAGAEAMRQAGVTGIQYSEEGSRGVGKGTKNRFEHHEIEYRNFDILNACKYNKINQRNTI